MTAQVLQTTSTDSGAPMAGLTDTDSAGLEAVVTDGQLPVLICDDREDVRRELSRVFQLRAQGAVESVGDGSDLLTAYEATSPVQVMIGVHPGSTFGVDALDLLLEHHPTALPVVYGSRCHIEYLARVYARGAAGLVLWELP